MEKQSNSWGEKHQFDSHMVKAKPYTINAPAFNINALYDFVLVVQVKSAKYFAPKVENCTKLKICKMV